MVSNARLERIILEKIVSAAKKEFVKKSRLIKLKIAPVVYSAVYDSPEMSSVRNGVLKFDFGLTSDPTVQIAKAVAASCEVKVGDVRLAGNQILGGITIGIQPQDYLNVLSIPQAVNVVEDGAKLPWLEWLTLKGNSIIIVDFGVSYFSGLGRTGGAIMTKGSRPFKVNSMYSGDAGNNFITRSIEKAIPNISKAIEQSL
jgi:hypothetical protein